MVRAERRTDCGSGKHATIHASSATKCGSARCVGKLPLTPLDTQAHMLYKPPRFLSPPTAPRPPSPVGRRPRRCRTHRIGSCVKGR